jgi:hypothetical protein
MRRISSKATFYYKRVLPFIWFGLLGLFIVGALVSWSVSGIHPPPLFLLAPVAICAVGYFIMRKLVFDMVDEVLDDGKVLIVRNGTQEQRIPYADIMNVGYSTAVNPPRVTLSLRQPGIFGSTVTFCGPLRFIPFSKNPEIEDLIVRIDARRRA